MHVDILDIKYHNVTGYRGTFYSTPRREMCPEHPDQVIKMFCVPCDIPVCFQSRKHQNYIVQFTSTVSENKQMQFNNIIINISCQSIYNAQVLLSKLKSEIRLKYKDLLVCRFLRKKKNEEKHCQDPEV